MSRWIIGFHRFNYLPPQVQRSPRPSQRARGRLSPGRASSEPSSSPSFIDGGFRSLPEPFSSYCWLFICCKVGGGVDLESSTVTVTVELNTPVCSRSGGGRTLRDHPAASWDTGHRGVRGHLAHAAAGHRPLSDRVHQDPQVRLQHRREETQVRSETGKQSREVAFAKFCFRH